MQSDQEEQVKVRVLPDRRVSREDAAKILGRAPKTLAIWKGHGWGPRPIIVGGRVFHDYDECLAMARGEKPVKPALAA
jgi:hypothetical protein